MCTCITRPTTRIRPASRPAGASTRLSTTSTSSTSCLWT